MNKEDMLKRIKEGKIAISYDSIKQADEIINKLKELEVIKRNDILISEYPNLEDIDYRINIFPIESEWMFVQEDFDIKTITYEEFFEIVKESEFNE